jgi:hypothetical protein
LAINLEVEGHLMMKEMTETMDHQEEEIHQQEDPPMPHSHRLEPTLAHMAPK